MPNGQMLQSKWPRKNRLKAHPRATSKKTMVIQPKAVKEWRIELGPTR